MNRFLVLAILSLQTFLQANDVQPDRIYYNAKITTLDDKNPTASAVAIQGGKFIQVGSDEEIKKRQTSLTEMIDLQGKRVIPGLIDAHCHPMESIMMKETWVDCRYPKTQSVSDALQNISKWVQTTPSNTWVLVACVSASENKFIEKRLPTKAELDKVAPNNPLLLANGAHMFIVNSKALQQLGITKEKRHLPHGGTALLDTNDEPNGVLTDAMDDVPLTLSEQQIQQYYTKSIQKLWNSYGFTSILAITPAQVLPVLQKVAQAPLKPTLRYAVSVWTSANGENMPTNLQPFNMLTGTDSSWYTFKGIKRWIDGENDCRTGYMYQPYLSHFDTDPPGGRGSLLTSQDQVNHFVNIAQKNNVIPFLHCSGDAAIDIGLTAYEQMPKASNLFRIEHYGMFQLSPKQLERAKALMPKGLKVCIQPTWLLDLVKSGYENMGPERASTGFQFRSMVDAGLEPAAGTDMTGIYLENINPFMGIYALVTRNSDMGIFQTEQAVSIQDALKMWTIWAAKSMNEEKTRGSIEPGKYADMTVLSEDIYTIPPENIKNMKALKTIVGGEIVYEHL